MGVWWTSTRGSRRPAPGSLLLDGVSYVVDLGEAGADTLLAVDGETFRVRLDDPGAGRRRGPTGAAAGGGAGQRLVAPMPGKVVKVLVEVGQPVERGAGLVVLEAMKMENEFRATGSGMVTRDPRGARPGGRRGSSPRRHRVTPSGSAAGLGRPTGLAAAASGSEDGADEPADTSRP